MAKYLPNEDFIYWKGKCARITIGGRTFSGSYTLTGLGGFLNKPIKKTKKRKAIKFN